MVNLLLAYYYYSKFLTMLNKKLIFHKVQFITDNKNARETSCVFKNLGGETVCFAMKVPSEK